MKVAMLLVLLAEPTLASSVWSKQKHADKQALQMRGSESSVQERGSSVRETAYFPTPNPNCSNIGYTWAEDFPSMFTHSGQICPRKRTTEWGTADCQWKKEFPQGANIAFVHVGKASGSTASMTLTRAIRYFGVNLNISELHTGASRPGHGLDQNWDLAVIVTRDPVTRTVSALNYELEASKESMSHKKLLGKLAECYPTTPGGANNFSRDLNEHTPCGQAARRCIHESSENYPAYDAYHAHMKAFNPKDNWIQSYCGHINMGHAHYLSRDRNGAPSLMTQMRLGTLKSWIVRTETFDEDMDGAFKWLCIDKVSGSEAQPQKVVPQVTAIKGQDRHGDTEIEPQNMEILKNHLNREYQTLEALEQLADNGKDTSFVERIAAEPAAGFPPGFGPQKQKIDATEPDANGADPAPTGADPTGADPAPSGEGLIDRIAHNGEYVS